MNTEQERAAFEAWMRDNHPGHCLIFVNGYLHKWPQRLWEAYQAGRAALQSQASGQSAADEIEGLRAHVALLKSALAQSERENDELRRAQPAASAEPVAWAAVHFGGRRDGKIYTTCDTREQIEAYIQDVHRSSDSLTLRARPLAFADVPVAAQAPAANADALARLIKAAEEVLCCTEAAHRPPVRETIPAGGTARVRIHALADLHDAIAAMQRTSGGEE